MIAEAQPRKSPAARHRELAPLRARLEALPVDGVLRLPLDSAPVVNWVYAQAASFLRHPATIFCAHRVDGELVILRVR